LTEERYRAFNNDVKEGHGFEGICLWIRAAAMRVSIPEFTQIQSSLPNVGADEFAGSQEPSNPRVFEPIKMLESCFGEADNRTLARESQAAGGYVLQDPLARDAALGDAGVQVPIHVQGTGLDEKLYVRPQAHDDRWQLGPTISCRRNPGLCLAAQHLRYNLARWLTAVNELIGKEVQERILGQLTCAWHRHPLSPLQVRRTPRISCEAVPPSVLPAGAQGGTSVRSTGAALSFVSCIRLFGGSVIPARCA
jgi:hypothetical protein